MRQFWWCELSLFSKYSYREKEACRDNIKQGWDRQQRRFRLRARWNKTHDVPLKPTSAAGLYKYTCFFLCLVFTSISFCNTVSAWSCLVWPTVSLFCLSGKGLAWRFHALFSVSPFCLWGWWGTVSKFCLFSSLTVYVSPSLFLKSLFLVPVFAKNSLHLYILFHVVPLYNYSFPSSIAFACLSFYFREPLLSAGPGVLPSVQDDMSGWRDTSCVDPFDTYSSY